jgi:hypothetical protein
MEAANAGILDVGTGDFLFWWIGRILDPADNNLRAIAGKRASNPFPGWELWITPNGPLQMNLYDGTNQDNEQIANAWTTSPLMVVTVVDRNADSLKLFARQDGVNRASDGQTIAATDCTAADGTFRVGNQTQSEVRTPASLVSASGIITGTGARGFNSTNFAALAAAMRMP